MERISQALLASFRHQLWLEHIEVLEEFQNDTHIVFALEEYAIPYWSLDNLRRITPFSIMRIYVDGNQKICFAILKDS